VAPSVAARMYSGACLQSRRAGTLPVAAGRAPDAHLQPPAAAVSVAAAVVFGAAAVGNNDVARELPS
jgi:hypothetical protein